MKRIILICAAVMLAAASCNTSVEQASPRHEQLLTRWQFSHDALQWEDVTVPHDWAITGPFDRSNDIQVVAVTQNLETAATEKTGRTGGLPYVGKGYYRTTFDVPDFDAGSKSVTMVFDGAMSSPEVFVNGEKAGEWALGYNSFHLDVTGLINRNGRDNLVEVKLENLPLSSRWYPGAGLYRNVHVITTDRTHIPVWGTFIITPEVTAAGARAHIDIEVENPREGVIVRTTVTDSDGLVCAMTESPVREKVSQDFLIADPYLWYPESPELYNARTELLDDGAVIDCYDTRFGIRTVELVPDEGFFLNGELRKFQGVCNHHDLGPLGAAVNRSALRHQLEILKDMGCDAIRTTHNMPAPELVGLCDEMGFMMIVEAFDEWDIAKCENGYHLWFDRWAEKDLVNMVRHYRNNPSVIMWSIGNEVPTQCSEQGYRVAQFLQDICHREDPTRLVTCGLDQADCIMANGFGAMLDVVGFNYRTHKYSEAYERLPQKLLLGSETASTVSSRGAYKLPVEMKAGALYDDNQSSAYDVEHCWWSNVPDVDFQLQDDYDWTIGQFVWTGFDYLGEPSPYDTDNWPSHSSYFGIMDLASLPKDRFYLYRSQWNRDEATLHLLPHWNWAGHEGENVPVFCYTSYPAAELFVNGVSQGIKTFDSSNLLTRYRLIWPDVIYEPGEIEVVAYDDKGEEADRTSIRTAGEPYAVKLETDDRNLCADGMDLCYITVSVVDRNGDPCPLADNEISFAVSGRGTFRAVANGDPTCVEPFQKPRMHLFNGKMTAIVQAGTKDGRIIVEASSEGLRGDRLKLHCNHLQTN